MNSSLKKNEFFVYLIGTKKKSKITTYVGYTNNVKKRLKLHNDGKGAKFTKGRNWKLIFFKRYDNKNIAMREEYKLKKNYPLRKKIKNDYFNKWVIFINLNMLIINII